jgi:hypothetical protein
MLAFFAFIIAGTEAILGVFNLKSHVTMAGGLNAIVCKPVSTSLVTSRAPSLTSTFEAKVA